MNCAGKKQVFWQHIDSHQLLPLIDTMISKKYFEKQDLHRIVNSAWLAHGDSLPQDVKQVMRILSDQTNS